MATLNDICSIITDGSHFSPQDEGVGYPMLSVKDMREDDFDYSSCKHVGEDAFRLLEANGCKPYLNDVVVAKDGSFLKSAFSIKEERNIALLSSIAILRPKTDVVFPDYLCHYLRSDSVYRLVSLNYITGTALKRIILQGLKKLPINLPSIEEQKKRALVLNKINQEIVQRKKQLQKLDDLVKARFVEMFGEPVLNKKNWIQKSMKEVCSKITDGEHGSVPRVDYGHPFLNAKHIKQDGSIDWNTVTFTSDEIHARIYKRCNPEYGDILLTTTGTIGNVAIVPDTTPFSMDRGITLLKIRQETVTSHFIACLLRFQLMLDIMTANVHASAIGHLFLNKVEQLPIIIPPIYLQNQFSGFVTQINKSKLSILQSLEKLETLKQSLMQQYFG